ncbi:MAG TPA: 4Fe-4S dicluster domain-containing protein [Tepidisphaeraceae bacterium]|nr:4Fe-4S dicluster domain-containing protein [Tepidisphaeraceae bacterium]
MREDKQVNRRRFFREGLRELLKPLSEAMVPIEEAIRQLERLESAVPKPIKNLPQTTWLRPPGALQERSFLDTCSRCGTCVNVCPAQCIKIDPAGFSGGGAPYIEPDIMPCVVCDGLVCMRDCPSGALVPTALGLIDMGTAVWREENCLRSHGEECTICIDKCPIGEVAIELRDGKVHVIEDGCTGCGVCQHDCPTSPKSIVVTPCSSR